MAYGIKYIFSFESQNGVDYFIRVLQDGYTGPALRRRLGGSPVLKRQQNGRIHGSSLSFLAEAAVDGEFAEFYTSDAKEFKVDLFRGSTFCIWTGFISTEVHAEPSIAVPYDARVLANDGLGELKLTKFAPAGMVTIASHLRTILYKTGEHKTIHIASQLCPHGDTRSSLLSSTYMNLDHLAEAKKTNYEVLTLLLNTLQADIFLHNDAWFILREADYSAIDSSLSVVTVSGRTGGVSTTTLALSTIKKSLGQMGVADMWPEGYLSKDVKPASKSVSVKAPWTVSNALQNADFAKASGLTGWTLSGYYLLRTGGYLQLGTEAQGSQNGQASQTVSLLRLVTPLKITAVTGPILIQGSPSGGTHYSRGGIRFRLKLTTYGGDVYYASQSGWVEEETWTDWLDASNYSPAADETHRGTYTSAKIEWSFPAPEFDVDDEATLQLSVEGDTCALYSVALTSIMGNGGYNEIVWIGNGAIGEADELEILGGRVPTDKMNAIKFLRGVFVDSIDAVDYFDDAKESDRDFLAITALAYARSVALPRLVITGDVDVPFSLGQLPIFIQHSVTAWLREYSWDLKTDRLTVDAISLPVASLSVQSDTVEPMDGSGGSSSGGSSGGGGGGGGGSIAKGVTSVDMTVPAGMSVTGGPIRSSGVLRVSLLEGYIIPTTQAVNQGVNAYLWGDHSLAGYAMQADLEELQEAVEELGGETGLPKWFFAPQVKLYSGGYNNDYGHTALTPYFGIRHPFLDKKDYGAEVILMIYNKRRGRASSYQPPIYPKYRNAWGEAKGGIHSDKAPTTTNNFILLDVIRLWILHHYICAYNMTKAQVKALTMAQFRDNWEQGQLDKTDFRFGTLFYPTGKTTENWKLDTKESRVFGLAIRVPNPLFAKYASEDPSETTREITAIVDNKTVKIPRYFYTEVVPFRVHCHKVKKDSQSGDLKYELGIEFDSGMK